MTRFLQLVLGGALIGAFAFGLVAGCALGCATGGSLWAEGLWIGVKAGAFIGGVVGLLGATMGGHRTAPSDAEIAILERLNATRNLKPQQPPWTAQAVGLALEERCAQILARDGWLVQRTALSYDGGVDLIATKREATGITQTVYVQCKQHAQAVGVEVVRELLGILPDRHAHAILAVPNGLTAAGARLARERRPPCAYWQNCSSYRYCSSLSPKARLWPGAAEGDMATTQPAQVRGRLTSAGITGKTGRT